MELLKPGRWTSRSIAVCAVCLMPVLVFYVLLWREMRPVPIFDDYHAILYFALNLQDQHGAMAKLLYVLAAQHDEYKLIVEHAVVALDWAFTRQVHFGLLIWLGNLLVLGVGALLWTNTFADEREATRRMVLFAPVVCLLFQLNYVENLDWAMCGLQTMPVILFTMAALHFVLREGRRATAWACVSVALASLSSANGFLIAPIGLLVLVSRRRLVAASAWTASVAVALGMYLYRYQRFVPIRSTESVGPGAKVMFFLSFIGGAVENMHHQPLRNGSVVLGLLILGAIGHACYTRFYRGGAFVFSLALWCLLSAVIVAQMRSYQGADLSLTGRYKIYSDLLLICAYVYAARRLIAAREPARWPRGLCAGALAVAILFAASADVFGYQYLRHRRQRVELGLAQYRADPGRNPPEISLGGEPFWGPEPEFARVVLNEAERRGMYRVPGSTNPK